MFCYYFFFYIFRISFFYKGCSDCLRLLFILLLQYFTTQCLLAWTVGLGSHLFQVILRLLSSVRVSRLLVAI